MKSEYCYEYEQDNHYCYPNSSVLKNKLNIQKADELKSAAERENTSLRTTQAILNRIEGNFDFELFRENSLFLVR